MSKTPFANDGHPAGVEPRDGLSWDGVEGR